MSDLNLDIPATSSKRGRLIALALIALPLALFFFEVVGYRVFIQGDLQSSFYPYHKTIADMLLSGHLPLWNPYSFCGIPLIGDGQNAIFYPINWLYFLMEAGHAMSLGIVLNFSVAAAGMICLSRTTLQLSWPATCIATLAFTFNGFMVAQVGQPSMMAGESLIPLLFAAADYAFRSQWSAKRTIALAAVVTLQLICGHLQIPIYAAMALVLYAIILVMCEVRDRRLSLFKRIAAQLAASYLIGLAIAAGQLLPWLELFNQSTWHGPATYEAATTGSLSGTGWLRMIWPHAAGAESFGYIGIVPLVFALLAIVSLVIDRRSQRANLSRGEGRSNARLIALAGFTAFMLLIAAGAGTPFGRLVYASPVVGALHFYSRAIGVAAFGLAALAGIGVDRISISRTGIARFAPIIVAGFLCLATLMVAAIVSVPAKAAIVFSSIAVAGVLCDAVFPRFRRFILVGLVAAAACDLGSVAISLTPTVTASEFTKPSAAANFLRQTMAGPDDQMPPFRIISDASNDRNNPTKNREAVSSNWAMTFGLADASGFNSLQPRRQLDLVADPQASDPGYGKFSDAENERTVLPSNLLNELDVRFILVPHDEQAVVDPSWRRMLDNEFVSIYSNPTPRGWASFPKQVLSEGLNEANVLGMARLNDFPSDRIAYAQGLPTKVAEALTFAGEADPRLFFQPNGNVTFVPPSGSAPPYDPPAAVRIGKRTPNEIDFEIDASRPRFVTLSEPFFPGWELLKTANDGTLDPVTTYRTNSFFRGFITDAGATNFEMLYRPHWLYSGLLLSLAAIIGCGASLIAEKRTPRGLRFQATLQRAVTIFNEPFVSSGELIGLQVKSDGGVRTAALAIAAMCLGVSIQLRDGLYTPAGAGLLFAAIAFTAFATLVPFKVFWPDNSPRADRVILGLAIPLYFVLMAGMIPAVGLQTTGFESFRFFPVLLTLAAFVACSSLMEEPPLGRLTFPILLALFASIGVWVIQRTPNPTIDVFLFQRDAAEALLHGHNPYAMTFRNMYGDHTNVYAADVMQSGRLLFGYPYMPVTLLLTTAGHFVFGDYRYSLLIATLAAAVLIAFATPSRISLLAAMLWLFTPRSLFAIAQGWTEPIIVMLVAGVIFTAFRFPRALPYALGLLLAAKQYMPAAVLLAPLLIKRDRLSSSIVGMLIRAGIAASIVSLPLILWNPSAFWNSAVALQFKQPFRFDALSFLVPMSNPQFPVNAAPTGTPPPFAAAISFVAILAGIGLSLWRGRRDPAGFAGAVALSFLLFFAFNKQAFANYYMFVIGSLWCAAAAMNHREESVL